MSLPFEVFKHISYLYFVADEIKGAESLNTNLTDWKDFFLAEWNRLVSAREEAFLECLELSIDYSVLLECKVPGGVDSFKKVLYTRPSFLLSCMSAGLHLATLQRYSYRLEQDGFGSQADFVGDTYTDHPVLPLPAVEQSDAVETIQVKKNEIAEKLLGGRLTSHLFFSETRMHCARVRLENFVPISLFSSLRSHSIGCILSIVGQVIRLSLTKPMILSALFTCNKCGCSFFKKFKNGIFEYSSRCYNDECNWTTSTIQRHCVQTTNYQTIRLQEESRKELKTESRFGENTVNAFVDVELTGGLVDQCCPGNVVQVVGVVDATPCLVYDDLGGHNSTFNIVVKAVSLKILRKRNSNNSSNIQSDGAQWNSYSNLSHSSRNYRSIWKVFRKDKDSPSDLSLPGLHTGKDIDNYTEQDELSEEEEASRHGFIRDIYYNEPNRFYLAVASLCRHAVGRPYIKAGLLLSLLGGVPLHKHGQLQRRGNIHCLLVGDSGVGKSLMLRSLCSMMDGAFFFSGGSVTASGLTAAVIREKGNSEYCLEAGALVLSSGGTCCIDELDKTTYPQQNAFLEAMESQSVSVAKGGIICTLNAQCTVICAANPVNGKFNCNTTVYKNIKLLPPLISRFDLLFLIMDNRGEERDTYITGHILNKGAQTYDGDDERTPKHNMSMKDKISQYKPHEYLDEELLKSYIAYGKNYINPKFTPEARATLQRFYSELRNLSRTHVNSIPITTRQLEGIIRLCQARARGDLCDHITVEHVEDVCELFKNTGHYPGYIDGASSNSGNVKKPRARSVTAVLNVFESRLRAQGTSEMNQREMLELAKETLQSCQSNIDPEQLVERANICGHILKQGKMWRIGV